MSTSNQPAAPSAVGATVVTPSSAEPESGMPLANQPGAPQGQEGAPEAPLPTAPESQHPFQQPCPEPALTPLASTEPPPAPPPRVVITVDKAAQRMRVTVDGKLRYSWPVSTGRPHYETPSGTFRPLRLARVHYSKEWDHAPMPHSDLLFRTRARDPRHQCHTPARTTCFARLRPPCAPPRLLRSLHWSGRRAQV